LLPISSTCSVWKTAQPVAHSKSRCVGAPLMLGKGARRGRVG
jgi:hypothetical protein